MNRRKFLLSASGLFIPAFPAIIRAQLPVVPAQSSNSVAILNMVTAVTHLGTVRNDLTNYMAGIQFRASSAITITALGRYIATGNSTVHQLVIFDQGAHAGTNFAGSSSSAVASASVNASLGVAGTFLYSTIAPVTLVAGHVYAFYSYENTTDNWYDSDNTTTVTLTGDFASSDGYTSIYTTPQSTTSATNSIGANATTFGPLNLKYHL